MDPCNHTNTQAIHKSLNRKKIPSDDCIYSNYIACSQCFRFALSCFEYPHFISRWYFPTFIIIRYSTPPFLPFSFDILLFHFCQLRFALDRLYLMLLTLALLIVFSGIGMQTLPNLVEENFSPTGFQPCRPRFFYFELHQMIFHNLGTLATFQHMCMDVLTSRVCAKGFRSHGEVFSESGMAVAMATLESGISYRSLGACDESIGFREQARFYLTHQRVYIWWNHFNIVWENNVPA